MAVRPSAGGSDNEHYLTLLDELILSEYRRLSGSNENRRMGDFLKMIELRHKLTPPGADKKEFWDAMEKIRKGVLADKPRSKRKPESSRRKRKKGA